jgi:ABC-type sugar transport system permease subunit
MEAKPIHGRNIPTVVSSKIWAWMFNDIYGVVNVLLINFHLISQKIAFLATPATALPVIIAVDVWKTTQPQRQGLYGSEKGSVNNS